MAKVNCSFRRRDEWRRSSQRGGEGWEGGEWEEVGGGGVKREKSGLQMEIGAGRRLSREEERERERKRDVE